jgi:outer membrane lipoprotein-sorting protein
VVARLERQLVRVQSYRGTMAVTVELMGQPQRSEGPVLFRRPNLTRTEMTWPMPIGQVVSVNDGHRMWIHQSTANHRTPTEWPRQRAAPRAAC